MKNLLCVGILVALPGLAQAAGKANSSSQTVLGVPCSEIFERGIDMQENLRAGMIRVGCGLEAGGEAGEAHELDSILDQTNTNIITGAEILPHVTQSESMAWSTPDGQTIVVTYNDSRDVGSSPINIAGVSVSFDGGNTFERTSPHSPFTGHGANFGDPVVVYNERLQSWYAGFLASGCGPDGIAMWTSTDAMNWTAAPCAHNGGGDDRESMWVDNNSASPFYGRMYVSWNDFAAGQNIFVVYSDNGTTWSAPVQVNTGAAFVRNVQLTGSPGDDGTVFIAGMNEGGGGVNPRVNIIYRSLDGGAHWTAITMGPAFPPPGQAVCGYFAAIFPNWRHMGWGQPAVGPDGVVHYAYAARGANPGDDGDILYTRSENNGDTWSTPITLNSDAATGGNRVQWMPSLSVTPQGQVVVSWYDRRNTQGDDYEVWGIRSADNGMTWDPDERFSDRVIPQPEQPDPQIVFCYNGDYNYHSAVTGKNLLTWTDGRVQVNGHNQQDVFFAMIPQVITGGTLQGTVTDTTGAVVAGARVDAVGPVTRHVSTNRDGNYTFLGLPPGAYDMTVTAFGYNQATASGVVVMDGQTTIQNFTLTAAPAHSVSGTVTSSATGLPVAGATVTIQGTPIPPATTDANGMYLFAMVPEGTYTIQASPPTTSRCLGQKTTNVTVNMDVIVDFALDARVDGFGYSCDDSVTFNWMPGTVDAHIDGDDFTAPVTLPFPFTFYGQTYSVLYVSTDGFATVNGNIVNFVNQCLPFAGQPQGLLAPLWVDLFVADPGRPPELADSHIYSATIGDPGSRRFIIEWRNATFFAQPYTNVATFEIILNEADNSFVYQYNRTDGVLGDGRTSTVGIENQNGSVALQYSCREAVLSVGKAIKFYRAAP